MLRFDEDDMHSKARILKLQRNRKGLIVCAYLCIKSGV